MERHGERDGQDEDRVSFPKQITSYQAQLQLALVRSGDRAVAALGDENVCAHYSTGSEVSPSTKFIPPAAAACARHTRQSSDGRQSAAIGGAASLTVQKL